MLFVILKFPGERALSLDTNGEKLHLLLSLTKRNKTITEKHTPPLCHYVIKNVRNLFQQNEANMEISSLRSQVYNKVICLPSTPVFFVEV